MLRRLFSRSARATGEGRGALAGAAGTALGVVAGDQSRTYAEPWRTSGFGGREVGIGFSGTYDGEGAECEATALAGKRSIRFRAVLRKLVAA